MMTAFVGVVQLDGGQPDDGDLDDLVRSIGHWGRGSWRWATAGACFGQVGSNQFVPSAAGAERGSLICATARLDNRDELADSLGINNHDAALLSDERLLATTYERFGEACPDRVNGDWTLAAWSPENRRLFLARDHFGNTALYYARVGERVAFASDIKALRSLRWARGLNEARIASLLVGGGADDPTSTVYAGISCIPPAHTVTIEPGRQATVRYWRVEETPDSGPVSHTERAELLRDTLRAAVSSRLKVASHVGAMLSGGLDSGAVTAFAAEYLQRQRRRLTAFTSVPAFANPSTRLEGATIDEGPGAADVVRAFDSIDHILVSARTVSPVAGIRRALAVVGAPSVAAANLGWITEIMDDARARRMDVLLTGQAGDFVMTGRPPAPSWRRDWSARRYRPMLRRASPNWLLRLRAADWKPWRLADAPWKRFSVINSDFAREVALAERLRDVGHDPRNVKPAWDGPAAVARFAMSDGGAIWSPLAAAYGLTILDPLQDKRVMELMFSAPQPVEALTTPRWLFRQALVGVLPEEVRLNRRKGVQSADLAERLVASWAEVDEALALAEGSPLARRCLDLPYCRALAESLRSPLPPSRARRNALMLVNGISAALFLAETWEHGGPG